MAEGAALLVDEVLPREPMRQWVLSVPFALRYLFATDAAVMGQVLGIVYRAIASHLIKAAGYHKSTARTGTVTLIQRFGSALNLDIHFYILFLDGVSVTTGERLTQRQVPPPTVATLETQRNGENAILNLECLQQSCGSLSRSRLHQNASSHSKSRLVRRSL